MAISLLGVFWEFVIVANIGSNKYQYTAARSSSKHVAADSITNQKKQERAHRIERAWSCSCWDKLGIRQAGHEKPKSRS